MFAAQIKGHVTPHKESLELSMSETFLRDPNEFRLARDPPEYTNFALFFGIFDEL